MCLPPIADFLKLRTLAHYEDIASVRDNKSMNIFNSSTFGVN